MADDNRLQLQDLEQARALIEQVKASLQNQRALLKQHGMNLPPMVTTSLQAVEADLDTFETDLLEEQTELQHLRALADLNAKITTSLDVDTVLQDAMDIVIVLTRAERGYIILYHQEKGTLQFRVSKDETNTASMRGTSQPPQVSQSVLRDVLVNRQPLLADNAYEDKRLQNRTSIADLSLRSVLCVPLLYKDDILGVVYVDNRLQAGVFTERAKNTLMAFANTVAVALANARLYEDIQRSLNEITRMKNLMDDVFASIGSGIIATETNDDITTFNRAAEAILAMPAHEVLGRPLSQVLPHITTELGDYLTAARDDGEPQIIDTELITAEQRRVALNLRLTPIRDARSRTQGVAVVVDDVTEKVAREQELHVMKTYLPPELVDDIHAISNLALGGERREVTCVFAEVLPLHVLKRFRPQEAMDAMNEYLAIATECIHETRGVIDKYMGNEVMALYNSQLNPMPDHALMAIEGALLMRERFVTFYKQLGIDPDPHHYRIGLHTGVATLGNVGSLNRRDFTAIGDTINLAKRLEENTTGGQIIISQETLTYLQASRQASGSTPHNGHTPTFRLEELEPIQVKGRQQKTRIYEVFRD